VKINEAYTSQTCPVCGHRHKPTGRIYKCKNKECNFVGIRDEVGSANILNKHLHGGRIEKNTLLPTSKVKYLRPVKLRVFQNDVARLAGGKLLSNTLYSVVDAKASDSNESSPLDNVA
jgi:putative transposase